MIFQRSIRCECYISYSKCLYQELWPFARLCSESRTESRLGMRLQNVVQNVTMATDKSSSAASTSGTCRYLTLLQLPMM